MQPEPAKLPALREVIGAMDGAVVAFSGGVDSALVLRVAVEVLGDRALAVTGKSPAVPARELEEAKELAASFGARYRILETDELSSEGYVANGPDRCYWCKSELFDRLGVVREQEGLEEIIDGTNADDLGDHRPGMKARREREIRSPLVEVGMTKAEVREASRFYGLPTADKPAMACLASRLPYGTSVTPEALARVEAAEEALKALGFRQLRVRHHDDLARIEIDPAELDRALQSEMRAAILRDVRAAGYRWVSIDLEGYRTGSLNELLPGPSRLETR